MLGVGTVLQGRYEIRGQLGHGGMGRVYLAADARLGNMSVAVKEMDASQVAPGDRQWTIDAFRSEAQILARLNHVGIARVMDYFSQGDYSYLVMEYVPGETLADALAQAPRGFAEGQALAWAGQLAVVLDYLHQQNPPVIFRDLKPGNVMVQPDGALKLIDFGIARLFKPGQTQDTVPLGTAGYAAPEHYGRAQTDARSDVYTLAVVLHQLLTGYDPTLSPMRLPPVRQLRPDVSPQTEAAVAQALQLNPDLRFASAVSFARALGAPLSGPLPAQAAVKQTEPVSPNDVMRRQTDETQPAGVPGWLKWAVGGLLLLALLLLGWVLLRDRLGGNRGQGITAVTEVATLVTQVVTPTPDATVVEIAMTTPDAPAKTATADTAPQATLAARETELAATAAVMAGRETEIAVTANAVSANSATAAAATGTAVQVAAQMTREVAEAQTATAEARPVACSRPPLAQFTGAYNRDRLGCPTNGGNGSVWMAMQTFDGGVMFWREDTDKIYVVYNSGGWARFDDVWLEGDAEFTCGSQESPPTPKRGFGRIWCDHNSVRNGLANAHDAEWGAAGATQDFERGSIVLAPSGRTYVLYSDNGTWR
ncbi:MAG: serine/threonine protein kinase [Candidatus Promineofilum sp.]|nr:serine/threonine protein kinase [Promineifilum sp.]